jgi:two-component system, NarL family, sensor kinase
MAELSQSEVTYFIFIGTLGMLSLTGGIAVFIAVYQKRILQEQEKQRRLEIEYQQKMIHSQIESQESERKRIAVELHDSIGSLLWATKLNVAFLGRSLPLAGELKDSYSETMKLLDQSIQSVKRISWELTPEAFQHSGLSCSIKEMCMRINGKGHSLTWIEEGDITFWGNDRALMVFRIVQELVNNAVNHSKGDVIQIKARWMSGQLLLSVEDNGIGFRLNDKERKGVGWWNITHRANLIQAQVTIDHRRVTGARVEIKVSIEA